MIKFDQSFLSAYMKMKLHYQEGWAPHLVNEAIEFIEDKIKDNFEILELGAGSSTIWFAQRVKKVLSFEHDKKYFLLIKYFIDSAGIKNIELYYDPNYPRNGVGNISGPFDVILIDGRGRVRNTLNALKLLKKGGYFILDDSQRKRYEKAKKYLNNLEWPRKDFIIDEANPFGAIFMTSIWHNREKNAH